MKPFNFFFVLLCLVGFFVGGVYAQSGAVSGTGFSGPVSSFQAYTPTFDRLYSGQVSNYWPIFSRLESDQCEATSDFVIAIPPGGCTPSVVRSDLLSEQNVPVFCQLYSVQTNPLIKVSSIRSISFRGQYPEGVSSVSFHPARAAARSYRSLTGDPLINNIGYVVLILKRNQVEENMEDWIAGNLTATIRYDAEEAFGAGRSDFYLPVVGDTEWNEDFERSSFWRGRGFLRATDIEGDRAKIQVRATKDHVVSAADLRVGETSQLFYLPGYYCRAGLRIKLNEIVSLEDAALLNIDGTEQWVRRGARILNGQCVVRTLAVGANGTGDIVLSCTGAGSVRLSLRENANQSVVSDATLKHPAEHYFGLAQNTTLELLDEFGSVQRDGDIGTFSEEALLEQIELAGLVGAHKTRAELLELFLQKYPSSPAVEWVGKELVGLGRFDYSAAYQNLYVGDSFHTIGISSFRGTGSEDKTVSFRIGSKQVNDVREGHNESVWDGILRVNRILPGRVEFSFDGKKSGVGLERVTVDEGAFGSIGGGDVYVNRVDVVEAAYVSVIPEVKHTRTDADFTFRIGIEKRAIELSPERSQKLLSRVENSIEDWEEVTDRLGDVVSAWKGACFATSAFLMAKNVLTGFNGGALARQKVMKQYRAICAGEEHKAKTRTECFNDLSAEIDRDVELMSTALADVNTEMDGVIENHEVSGGFLSDGTIVNQSGYVNDLKRSTVSKDWAVTINGVPNITREDLQTSTQVRAVLLAEKLKGQGAAGRAAELEMEEALKHVALEKQRRDAIQSAQRNVGSLFRGTGAPQVLSVEDEETRVLLWSGDTIGRLQPDGIREAADTKIQTVTKGGKEYLLVLRNSTFGVGTSPRAVYVNENNQWVPSSERFDDVVFDTRIGSGADCSYPWPTGTAEVRYYETGANKGNPAVVPFDLENGLYALISDSNGNLFSDSPKGFTSAGVAKYFRICSIGPNRVMEMGTHDDMCQTFSDNTAASVTTLAFCPQKRPEEVRRIYQRASEAIRQASAQYGRGRTVSVFDQLISVGTPLTQLGGLECQDFMSPDECKLMFNVCDPVVCPPSRCDLGGKNPVSDVIATGVVGSIAQCLPNAKEGILVPVCMSGVHAGLDAYVSILKSQQECLETNIESGELVGICDEITSIYTCEFFWRQASPLLNFIIPKLFTTVTDSSQGVRGGGEYLLAQKAWENLDTSVSYFTDNYAQNAFRAFRLRNVEEAGGAFCKNFLGTSFPTSAEGIGSLLEPESPSQFYAKFSEIPHSDVTVPATSQYKVYYHIYAGNERGVQYRVYLKSPPASGYYAANPIVPVKTGFIAKGTSADESIDFTAPEGYQELCVVIDAKEECGFKQVTSDFGLDYLSSKFIEEQAETTDITTENECISGSPSLYPLLQPNLQSGVEESLNPDISLRGIVRVCSHTNPASAFNSSRWKRVGHCGEERFGCWLDLNSVKEDLRKVSRIENTTLTDLEGKTNVITKNQQSSENAQEILSKARTELKAFTLTNLPNIITLLTSVTGDTNLGILPKGSNRERAEALSLKANAYAQAVKVVIKGSTTQGAGSRTTAGVGAPQASRVGSGTGTQQAGTGTQQVSGGSGAQQTGGSGTGEETEEVFLEDLKEGDVLRANGKEFVIRQGYPTFRGDAVLVLFEETDVSVNINGIKGDVLKEPWEYVSKQKP